MSPHFKPACMLPFPLLILLHMYAAFTYQLRKSIVIYISPDWWYEASTGRLPNTRLVKNLLSSTFLFTSKLPEFIHLKLYLAYH